MKLVPGRFHSVNGQVVRIKSRTNGCKGCAFDNPFTCPNAVKKNETVNECVENETIFVKFS